MRSAVGEIGFSVPLGAQSCRAAAMAVVMMRAVETGKHCIRRLSKTAVPAQARGWYGVNFMRRLFLIGTVITAVADTDASSAWKATAISTGTW